MEVEISQVLFTDVVDEVLPLIRDNFKESSWHNDRDLNLDIKMLQSLEEHRMLFCFTARVGGVIVGYTTYFLNSHPHVSVKQAYQDVIYVKPEFRKGMASIAHSLLMYAEHILISNGAKYIINGVPTAHDSGYSRLLKRMGYSGFESLYGKKV